MMQSKLLTPEFRALSAQLGNDPLQVQGPGGNTSIKGHRTMWIKASGTELSNALNTEIFVAVDRVAAMAEAHGEGDGSCRKTVLNPTVKLRPSIETTFHAVLDHVVVAHTHSVATLVHAVSPEGRVAARDKLSGLLFVMVPYAKPGLPLTRRILEHMSSDTKVFILENHGLICCGETVEEVTELIANIERRLAMPAKTVPKCAPQATPEIGYHWAQESWLAHDERASALSVSGSYYPDHVVFLGPALPEESYGTDPPAILRKGKGVLVKADATTSQLAMLRCLSDVLARLPKDWAAESIGETAEAELLNWDAEKYRQELAKRA